MDPLRFPTRPVVIQAFPKTSAPAVQVPQAPNQPHFKPRPEVYLSQGRAEAPEVYSRREFQRRFQESMNQACEADPLAAEANGRFQVGLNGDWAQSGPTVLELASKRLPLPEALHLGITAVETGIAVEKMLRPDR